MNKEAITGGTHDSMLFQHERQDRKVVEDSEKSEKENQKLIGPMDQRICWGQNI